MRVICSSSLRNSFRFWCTADYIVDRSSGFCRNCWCAGSRSGYVNYGAYFCRITFGRSSSYCRSR
jgi:hypothetical protein